MEIHDPMEYLNEKAESTIETLYGLDIRERFCLSRIIHYRSKFLQFENEILARHVLSNYSSRRQEINNIASDLCMLCFQYADNRNANNSQ